MSQSVSLWGATYSGVPAIEVPKSGGGMASFTDVTDTTAAASDVATGKYFYTAAGVRTQGTNAGGSGDGYVWQDAQGYVHLSDEEGTQPIVDSLTVSNSGTYTAPAGHVYNPVIVPSGSATPASSISATGATVSTGTNTLTLSKTVSNTPTVSSGFITSGTSGNSSVSLTASVNTRSSSDLTANTLTVTAPSGYYANSATKTLTDANLTAGNIKKDVSIFGVTGSYEGGGGTLITKNILANGTYNASADNADGYSSVTVNVSGASNFTLLGAEEFTVNTSVTSAVKTGVIVCTSSDIWTANTMIYVKIRDKAGVRAGYFYGSDSFFFNGSIYAQGETSVNTALRRTMSYTTTPNWKLWLTAGTTGYGVYGYNIDNTGGVDIYERYNSNFLGATAINGTFLCEVYSISFPSGTFPF